MRILWEMHKSARKCCTGDCAHLVDLHPHSVAATAHVEAHVSRDVSPFNPKVASIPSPVPLDSMQILNETSSSGYKASQIEIVGYSPQCFPSTDGMRLSGG